MDSLFDLANNTRMRAFYGIEAFVQVMETGSITAAADRLHTAKSSISETIRALEQQLGVRLFDRTTRKVQPTEAGQAFYLRCRRLLQDEEVARLEVQALQDSPSGHLRIAAPEAFVSRHLVPGLPAFLSAHPAVQIEFSEAATPVKLVEDGFDLAIRVVEAPAPGLVVRRLAMSRVMIVAAPGYLAQHGTPLTPQDVPRHRCIGFSPLPWRDTWRLGADIVPVQPVLLTDNAESLRAAAMAGIGLAAVPDWLVADALASGQLQRVLAGSETPVSGIFAVYPTNRLMVPKVRAFVDHAAGLLRSRGFAA